MNRHWIIALGLCVFQGLFYLPGQAQSDSETTPDTPPRIQPELIFAGYVGGPGDQGFVKVQFLGDRIRAFGPQNKYALQVELNPDGTFKRARKGGAWNYKFTGKYKGDHNFAKELMKKNKLTAGFRQVGKNLQQPIFTTPEGKLYGWNKSDAENARGKWAPYMADSRGTLIIPAPEAGYYFLAGTSDGGNSSFNTLPKDIHTMARMSAKISTNYPNGKSTWCFVYNAEGEQLRTGFRLRNHLNDAMYDKYGRLIMWGKGIANSDRTQHSLNVSTDGGCILVLDKDHTKHLFAMAMGSNIYGVAFDEESGIFAAVGYYQGSETKSKKGKVHQPRPFNQLNGIQEKPGGGEDAVLVIWRMWEPRYSEKRQKRIDDWKEKEAKRLSNNQ